jgi:hypothetical protein
MMSSFNYRKLNINHDPNANGGCWSKQKVNFARYWGLVLFTNRPVVG